MSTQYDSGFVTFDNTAAALAKNIRVKVNSSGQVLVSGAANDAIGITQEDALASTRVAVKLFSAEGTFLATADAAITRGALIYPGASGKISATAGMLTAIGYALEAATADGDIIPFAAFK
jgi:hypothetical protein